MSTANSSQPDPETLRRVVLDHVNLDSTAVDDLLRIFVDGVFNNAWRSGPIEDVHSTKLGPSDGQMFRMNTFLINALRIATTAWTRENGVGDIDRVDLHTFDGLMNRYRDVLLGVPMRVTPTETVEEVAGQRARKIRKYADQSMFGLREIAEAVTPATAIYGRILEGTMFRGEWGAPGWDEIVDSFVAALDSPDDDLWRFGNRGPRIARLEGVDRSRLADLLRHNPWDLSENEADGVIQAGIGFIKKR